MRGVLAGFFAAEARSGEHFGGIGKLERVEGAADAVHGVEVGLGEHLGHHLLFLLADAVLAGDGAAGVDAHFEDARGERFGGVLLAGDAAVVEDHGMQVAVAGVKDVGHAQAGFAAMRVDFVEDARKRGARNDAVLHDVVGRDAAHRGEGGFAAFPDEGAFGFGLRDANFRCAVGCGRFR